MFDKLLTFCDPYMQKKIKRILISRTDKLGDVVLTLPIIGYLKNQFPNMEIGFLCTEYTKPLVGRSDYIDEILCWNHLQSFCTSEQIRTFQKYDCIVHVYPNKKVAFLAKKARIQLRIGTSHRVYHWLTCNSLINLERNKTRLHEAQLNFILFKRFGLKKVPDLKEVISYFSINTFSDEQFGTQYPNNKINIALHPKSGGSPREWSLENFDSLIKLLSTDKYRIFITGSESERKLIEPLLQNNPSVIDKIGSFTLDTFLDFLSSIDIFVASSTGPLHASAALGTITIGLFPPIRPIDPIRWGTLGLKASYLVEGSETCNKCKNTKICECINRISPDTVLKKIESELSKHRGFQGILPPEVN